MATTPSRLLDCDHVLTHEGQIYRVIGNLDHPARALGYPVYSPDPRGDRIYRGQRYRKNRTEDHHHERPADAMRTYHLLDIADLVEHHDPIVTARPLAATLPSPWAELYGALTDTVGQHAVGVFGSALLGMHTDPHGDVRKDIDFVVHGPVDHTTAAVRSRLPAIRAETGFIEVSPARRHRQQHRYRRIFTHPSNTLGAIIDRRWAGLQLSPAVVSTIRFRDPEHHLRHDLVTPPTEDLDDVTVTGHVSDATTGCLFPATFTLTTTHDRYRVVVLWWKFAAAVRDDDLITARGSLLPSTSRGHPVLRITHYSRHWLALHQPGNKGFVA